MCQYVIYFTHQHSNLIHIYHFFGLEFYKKFMTLRQNIYIKNFYIYFYIYFYVYFYVYFSLPFHYLFNDDTSIYHFVIQLVDSDDLANDLTSNSNDQPILCFIYIYY